jgi:hypothetical protein
VRLQADRETSAIGQKRLPPKAGKVWLGASAVSPDRNFLCKPSVLAQGKCSKEEVETSKRPIPATASTTQR